ncbi:competence-stimulating peptide ComC [Streptococcus sp. 27098_8_103]|nr:competence-stimulating peptide ComC [Streptococcus mitis]
MKNTVNLDKFVELKEKDLQNIQGGEMRKMNEKSFNFFNIFRRR